MREHTARELVERARSGEGAAIGELFSRYWRAARAAAFGVTGEFAAAEDAAAEAFRQALAGLASLRDPDRFGPWLRTIVVRQARLERQHRHRVTETLADDDLSDRLSHQLSNRRPERLSDRLSDLNQRPDEALERIELHALIHHAMRELPARLREAMALIYFEGYDSDDAARFLDVPAGTLRRRLHEGRGELRRAVDRMLNGSTRMNEERERQIQRLTRLFDEGESYQALRESLALRPPPKELIDLFGGAPSTPPRDDFFRRMSERFTGPSDRATDPNHPVGLIAAAIRKALPEFQDWSLDVGEAAAHLDRLRAMLPPGFAEGRPGAFLRTTRAVMRVGENGSAQSIYQVLQDSPDEEAFRAAGKDIRLSDVLDLTWLVAGPLELRSVQEVLERLTSAVLPDEQVRFSSYDEPRYRSALQLHVGNHRTRFAHGGVLTAWPGRPEGVDAAHLRIFLEPWATIRSGHAVEFHPLG
jgi:RNA polymerase sigma factor (sigma-70 family)